MGNNNIVHLDISSNDITPDGAYLIFELLVFHQGIVSLDISSHEGLHRNRIHNTGAMTLKTLLANNHILTILNLSGTALGSTGLEYLAAGVKGNYTLLSLNIENNNIG